MPDRPFVAEVLKGLAASHCRVFNSADVPPGSPGESAIVASLNELGGARLSLVDLRSRIAGAIADEQPAEAENGDDDKQGENKPADSPRLTALKAVDAKIVDAFTRIATFESSLLAPDDKTGVSKLMQLLDGERLATLMDGKSYFLSLKVVTDVLARPV